MNPDILKYCKTRCQDTLCQGKLLKLCTKTKRFAGVIIVKRGNWYCNKRATIVEVIK